MVWHACKLLSTLCNTQTNIHRLPLLTARMVPCVGAEAALQRTRDHFRARHTSSSRASDATSHDIQVPQLQCSHCTAGLAGCHEQKSCVLQAPAGPTKCHHSRDATGGPSRSSLLTCQISAGCSATGSKSVLPPAPCDSTRIPLRAFRRLLIFYEDNIELSSDSLQRTLAEAQAEALTASCSACKAFHIPLR